MGARPQHTTGYRQLCLMLTAWRRHAGLSQRSLSQKLEKPVTYASKVEAGIRRIDPVELAAWCRACRIDPVEAYREFLGRRAR